jgi:hypothetical protein
MVENGDRPGAGWPVSRGSVHLVGSVPLASAEDVFRTVSSTLGDCVARIPDGETGSRSGWIGFQMPLLAAQDALVATDATTTSSDGGRRPRFELRQGAAADAVHFGELGYARAAIDSYGTFARLATDGVILPEVRFQVSLPTPLAPMLAFVAPASQLAVEPAYTAAMERELAAILDAIPPDRLAIQWDVAPEIGVLEGVWPAQLEEPLRQVTDRIASLAALVPDEAAMGFHFCYGDEGHQHFVQPADTGVIVTLANAVAERLTRPVDWVHLPVPRDRDDDAYFAPLTGLSLAARTTLYLGLVHYGDGVEGALRRVRAAARSVEDFGIATECGFGRRDPATIPALLALHRRVIDAAAQSL